MPRRALVFALAIFLFAPLAHAKTFGSQYGSDAVEKHFFMGIGGTYILEHLDINDVTADVIPKDHELDFDNSWGITGRMGYRFTAIFAAEVALDWLNDFDYSGDVQFSGFTSPAEIKVTAQTLTFAGRLQPPIGELWWFRPYLLVGGGMMNAKTETSIVLKGVKNDFTNSDTQPCGRIGGGLDLFLTESFSFGMDASYMWGFNELEELRFWNFAGIAMYHW